MVRLTFVGNSPLNYTDPTGHARIQDGPQQDKFKPSVANKYVPKPKPKPKKGNKGGGGGGGGGKDEGCKVLCDQTPNDPLLPQTPSQNDNPNINPPDPNSSYCGDISGLACAATITQDVATLIDLVGVGLIEAPAVAAGCLEGGPLGCAIAEVGVIAAWNLTLNNAETIASGLSFAFTLGDDLINNGGLGENSATSAVTFAAGSLPLTPSYDLAVDTYSSGYNHGFFNGVNTILTNGLFK